MAVSPEVANEAMDLVDQIAEKLGGEQHGWNRDVVITKLGDIIHGDFPNGGDAREAFDASMIEVLEGSGLGQQVLRMSAFYQGGTPETIPTESLENSTVFELTRLVNGSLRTLEAQKHQQTLAPDDPNKAPDQNSGQSNDSMNFDRFM